MYININNNPAIHPPSSLTVPSPGALKLFLHDIILSSGPIFHMIIFFAFSFPRLSFSHSILLLYSIPLYYPFISFSPPLYYYIPLISADFGPSQLWIAKSLNLISQIFHPHPASPSHPSSAQDLLPSLPLSGGAIQWICTCLVGMVSGLTIYTLLFYACLFSASTASSLALVLRRMSFCSGTRSFSSPLPLFPSPTGKG